MHAARVAEPVLSEAPSGPVAILAGSGDLPLLVADRLADQGRAHRILAFRGFASRALRRRADAVVGLLDVRRAVACLDSWSPAAVTLAGGIRRPDPRAALDAFAWLRNRTEIADILSRGDDNLLRAVLGLLEDRGHRLVGIHELAPELLARAGIYGRVSPSPQDGEAAALGMSLIARLAPFDVGQAAVVCGRRILAVEGPEGTDRMLARVASLRRRPPWRPWLREGVAVKAAKAGQDFRVDLPAIGPRTMTNAARAGLAGVAVASGSTLVLDSAATTAAADALGLFLVGLPATGGPEAPAHAAEPLGDTR